MDVRLTQTCLVSLLLLRYAPLTSVALQLFDFTQEVCYGELGCFSNGYPYTSSLRPIPYLPWSPGNISTEFWLYTRENYYLSQVLDHNDLSTVSATNFKPLRPTKFIIHGFVSSGSANWIKELKKAVLDAENVNVIVVNWKKGANPRFDYGQATANTRVVGAQIALLIENLKAEVGLSESNVHVIGHSLGAHIAGYAGERLRRMGRITGLDPAGPFFRGTEPKVRLDPKDALFVDAIHTDGQRIWQLGWGMMDPVGHADFYPNGGDDQPGCPGNEVDSGNWWDVTCNHGRSHDLMIDSIVSKDKPMVGHPCTDYDTFLAGGCDMCSETGCAPLGYYATEGAHTNVAIKYYLRTRSDAPYSLDVV